MTASIRVRSASSTSPEDTGSEGGGLTPLWLQLIRDRFRKALNRPFGGTVKTEEGNAALPTNRSDLLNHAAARLLLTHRLHGDARDVDQAEEVDVHLLADLVFLQLLEAARQAVAGVVDHQVDAAELVKRGFEGVFDGRFVCHVEPAGQVVGVVGVLE